MATEPHQGTTDLAATGRIEAQAGASPRMDPGPDSVLGPTLGALLDLLPLDDLPRTGWVLRGIERPESLAGHVVGVGLVALALAPRVDPALDLGRVLAMALVHDAPEARTGDLPSPATKHLPRGAKHAMEAAIAAEVVAPLSATAAGAYAEYRAGATREARFVRACDRLQLGVRLLGYERGGRRGLEEFWDTVAGAAPFGFEPCDQLLASLQAERAGLRGERAGLPTDSEGASPQDR